MIHQDKPLLTICIPTYQDPHYLGELLFSIRSQTFKRFKVVVIDNHSEKDYQSTLRSFSDLDITYIRNSENIGAMRNIEKAIHYDCDTQFIMAFHSDDRMHPRLVETEMDIMLNNPDMAFVGSDICTFNNSDRLPEIILETPIRLDVYTDVSDFVLTLLKGSSFNLGSVIYRKKYLSTCFMDLSRFSVVADRPFLCQVAKNGQIGFVKEKLVYYRDHGIHDARGQSLNLLHIIELYKDYRTFCNLSDKHEAKIFFTSSTNNLLDSYSSLRSQSKLSFLSFALIAQKEGVFRFRYIRIRGILGIVGILMSLLKLDRPFKRLRRIIAMLRGKIVR